jgi:hypothetical protein
VKIFLLFFLFASVPVFAQDNTSSKEEKKNEVISAKMKRQKAKKEWKEKRNKERADKKAVRDHEKRLQTKATRKRMHRDQRKADRHNQNKKEFFLIRLFKPKPKTGGW